LRDDAWVQENFWLSDASKSAMTVKPYGVLLLGRISLGNLTLSSLELPTYMNRSALIASFVGNSSLAVCTVHLESLDGADIRREQLKAISTHLKDYNNAIIMGDFNFDELRSFEDILEIRNLRNKGDKLALVSSLPVNTTTCENNVLAEILPDYVDIWKILHVEDVGYTFDSEINANLHGEYEQMRYDRVVLKSAKNYWKPSLVTLIGDKPIGNAGNVDIFASDHFGLLVMITTK